MDSELVIRGRRIGAAELCRIRRVAAEHWSRGRMAISQELCRHWGWRQENGALKDQVCRLLLRQLENRDLIDLPPPKRGISNHPNRRYYIPPDPPPEFCSEPLEGTLRRSSKVHLEMVRRSPAEELWNYLVYRYHYKGYRIIVGAHLKYLVYLEERPVACLSWSSSVFRIQSRDRFIGWDSLARSRNIRHLVNHSRFLILPWVRVKNLASHLLGLSSRVIARDWEGFYGYPLYLLESFVECSRFTGTCYRAANWLRVGQTRGHAKKNNQFYYHGQPKDVYLYPLVPGFRMKLLGGGAGEGGLR